MLVQVGSHDSMETKQFIERCLHCDENDAATGWSLCDTCAFRIYNTIGAELRSWDRKKDKRVMVRRILNTNGYFSL